MPFLDDDIVNLRKLDGKVWQYYWGDKIEVLEELADRRRVQVMGVNGPVEEGWIAKSARLRDTGLLRMSMIDVQQGDGMIVDTPAGHVIFVDSGDNQLFARHAAFRFRGTTAAQPLIVDLMLVTHGDADHFEGLCEIAKSESDARPNKSLFLAPRRVYHNGMVKRPKKRPNGTNRKDVEMLGATTVVDEVPFVTELVDDPASVAEAERNGPFNRWVDALADWDTRVQALTGAPIERRRLDHTSTGAFDFLAAEGVSVELIGPIVEDTGNGPGLRFLRTPPKDASLMLGSTAAPTGKSWSASHTINGHSIGFRLRYGNVRFLMTGDMNQESMQRLREALPDTALRSEILKVPHHGAADFDMEFLKEVGAVVSLISSGDESSVKEHIHPRATLMAALGKASRTTPAIIFCTELAAFFTVMNWATQVKSPNKTFFAFQRTNFGIAHVRTDGESVLAFTHSGEEGLNEAYRFAVSANGEIAFSPTVNTVPAPPAPA